MSNDLRSYLHRLLEHAPSELEVVDKPVETEYEIAAVVRKFQDEGRFPALLFTNITGYEDFSLVTNAAATRRKLCAIFESDRETLAAEFNRRLDEPQSVTIVDDAPVQSVVETGTDVDIDSLPITRTAPIEPEPYVTAAAAVTWDDRSERHNVGVYRMMQHESNQLGLWMAPGSDSRALYDHLESRDEPMEFAAIIGHHPATVIGSQVRSSADDLESIGGLLGESLEVTHCETVDLVVPAQAEVVIEGRAYPHERKAEGPFCEYHFLVGEGHDAPVAEITAISRRSDPIYYDIYNPYVDHVGHQVVPLEADITRRVSETYPQLETVSVPPSCSKFLVIAQIQNEYEGLAKQVGMAVLSARSSHLKTCIVVDEQTDPFDLDDVLWSIGMKTRPEIDIDVIRNTYVLDKDPVGTTPEGWPHVDGGIDSKILIDATTPHGIEFPNSCGPPDERWQPLDLDEYVADDVTGAEIEQLLGVE